MRNQWIMSFAVRSLFLLKSLACCLASDLDTIGVTQLRAFDATLVGAGVQVAQPEAGNPVWEVNPAAVGQPPGLFTWTSGAGTTTTFPNAVGQESGHANRVGNGLYGTTNGVAPGAGQIDNYEAGFFYNSLIHSQTVIAAKIVNQSFVFLGQFPTVDSDYDDYADFYKVLFVSGVGNGGAVNSPASAYNGIGVAALGGPSSMGPTSDGRSKPDLTAPSDQTSFSTPLVAGAAAVLIQAALREDAGTGTAAAASDPRTVKALLLNGAEKPAGWTNSSTAPLHKQHGAGVLNVLNSYRQLFAGRHSTIVTTANPAGDPHPPPTNTNNLPAWRGWDFTTLSSSVPQDRVNHYFIDLTSASNRLFTFTGTLVWHRQLNQPLINDLDLLLYNADDNSLVGASQSLVDNVEHLYLTNLPPARYNLQVLKNGGLTKRVTNNETYALAFNFGPPEPPLLTNSAVAESGFMSQLVGEPGQTYVLQGTTNFLDWFSVGTNKTSGTGFFDFTNTPAGTPDKQFYRAFSVP